MTKPNGNQVPMFKAAATKWSPQQEAIFGWFAKGSGNLVVRARAGTGKTTTIMEGISRAPEKSILLAAFNKRIAEELKTKLNNPNAEAKTLHSLGFGFVLRAWKGVKVDSGGKRVSWHTDCVCDSEVPKSIKFMISGLATLAKEMAPFASTEQELVSLQEEFDYAPGEEFKASGYDARYVRIKAIKVMGLAKQKDSMNAIDFADMLFVPLVNGLVKGFYDLVCVDEAQDMNAAQLFLAQRACSKNGRIVVVGDDRQAIYGFRGADSNSIDRLKTELSAAELGLTITYRCPKRVVAEAQRLVPDYSAADSAPEGQVVFSDMGKMFEIVAPGDFVLSRTNAPLIGACLRLLRNGIRARIEGRDIGSGLVNLVKKIGINCSMRVFFERLKAWEDKNVSMWRASDNARKAEEISDKADTIRELSRDVATPEKISERIMSLFSDVKGGPPQVVFSTVHKAKGLESNRVFIIKRTLYPYRGANQNIEERNIEYVAITRAKKELVWLEG